MTTENLLRGFRGGGWSSNDIVRVRVASRGSIALAASAGFLGFRCARVTTSREDTLRVFRGGGWDCHDAARVRAANRNGNALAYRFFNLGFRCSRISGPLGTKDQYRLQVRDEDETSWKEVGGQDQHTFKHLCLSADSHVPPKGHGRMVVVDDEDMGEKPILYFERLRGRLVPEPKEDLDDDGELVLLWPSKEDLEGEVLRTFHLLKDGTTTPLVYVPPSDRIILGEGDNLVETSTEHGFWIDEYPITQLQWWSYNPEQEFTTPYAEQPMVDISWNEAVAYCEWAGLSLPTEWEWEYAARGTDGRVYPWGNEEPTDELLHWSGGGCTAKTGPCHVGIHPKGMSPCGAKDMVGNVWEWTNSEWERSPMVGNHLK